MPDFLIVLFFWPSVMITTDSEKWQIIRPICVLMKFDHMWFNIHTRGHKKKPKSQNIAVGPEVRVITRILNPGWQRVNLAFWIHVCLFSCLSKGVSCLPNVLNFKYFLIWSAVEWANFFYEFLILTIFELDERRRVGQGKLGMFSECFVDSEVTPPLSSDLLLISSVPCKYMFSISDNTILK